MSCSIACIAPFQELGDLFTEVCQELQRNILVEVGDLEEGARQTIRMEESGTDLA